MKAKARTPLIHVFAAAALVMLLLGFMISRGTSAPAQQKQRQPFTTWSAFGGTSDSMQYSAFKQINKTNVN